MFKTFLARLRLLSRRARSLAGEADDEQKLPEKNKKLRKFREEIEKKNKEIELLQTRLAQIHGDGISSNSLLRSVPAFFVVGRAKSGTSWLRSILDAHPEILCVNEGRFFGRDYRGTAAAMPRSLYGSLAGSEHFTTWVKRSPWSRGEDTERHVRNVTRRAVDYFLTERLAKAGKKFAGDKTPLLSMRDIIDIAEIYPDAKVIHIVRDGRDVAISSAHHVWNSAERGRRAIRPEILVKRDAYRANAEDFLARGESIFAEWQLANTAKNWASLTAKAMEDGSSFLGNNYTEVRYEHLLDRPVEEVVRLLDFLGADASRQPAEQCVEATSFERVSQRERGHEDSSSFFRKGVAGDWRNVFTEKDKQIFKEVAGDILIELGYEEDNNW